MKPTTRLEGVDISLAKAIIVVGSDAWHRSGLAYPVPGPGGYGFLNPLFPCPASGQVLGIMPEGIGRGLLNHILPEVLRRGRRLGAKALELILLRLTR